MQMNLNIPRLPCLWWVFRFPKCECSVIQRGCSTHLRLWGASFISDEQQVTLTIDHNLLLEATTCRKQQPPSEVQEQRNTRAAVVLLWRDRCHSSDQFMDRLGEWWPLLGRGVNVYGERYRCEWSTEEVAKGDVTRSQTLKLYYNINCVDEFSDFKAASSSSSDLFLVETSCAGCWCVLWRPHSVLNSGAKFHFKLLSSVILFWRSVLKMFKAAILAELTSLLDYKHVLHQVYGLNDRIIKLRVAKICLYKDGGGGSL